MDLPQPENISLTGFLRWEQRQTDRCDWIDSPVAACAGGYEHAVIISNLNALFQEAAGGGGSHAVYGSDRELVPRDVNGQNLGSFYPDLFVSFAPEDRRGDAAHLPTLVVEVLSPNVGEEFTRKKEAYLGSARLLDYLIIDSTRRYVVRYAWLPAINGRRLVTAEYRRGPVPVRALGLVVTFDQIYAGTDVPAILYPVRSDDEKETEVIFD